MGEGIPTFLTVMAIHLKRKQLFKLRRLIRIIEFIWRVSSLKVVKKGKAG